MVKDDDTASKRPADETARDRATINLQRAFGDLVAKLTRAYEHAFEEAKADPTNFYVVALTAVANFLEKSDVKNEIAHKFIELASFIHEGSLPFLRPPKASGRTYDSQAFWVNRAYAVVGLECILRSGKMNLEDGAKYIAKKYPVFNRLKRNPSHSLAKSPSPRHQAARRSPTGPARSSVDPAVPHVGLVLLECSPRGARPE
jgi:hypothetical protein